MCILAKDIKDTVARGQVDQMKAAIVDLMTKIKVRNVYCLQKNVYIL